MKITLAAILLGLLLFPIRASNVDPQKVAEIRKLLQLDGASDMMNEYKKTYVARLEKRTDLSNSLRRHIENEVDYNQILDYLIPIYAKNFSLDDLKAFNAFYESPVGRRFAEKRHEIMIESAAMGKVWGARLGARIELEVAQARARKYNVGGN